MAGLYVARLDDVAVSAAPRTLVEVTAPGTASLLVRRAKITAKGITAGEQLEARLVRKSAAGTGTSFTAAPLGNYAAFAGSARVDCTVEGTISATLYDDGFNLLGAGWEWVPIDERGKLPVPGGGIIAITLDTAPAAARQLFAMIEFEVID